MAICEDSRGRTCSINWRTMMSLPPPADSGMITSRRRIVGALCEKAWPVDANARADATPGRTRRRLTPPRTVPLFISLSQALGALLHFEVFFLFRQCEIKFL